MSFWYRGGSENSQIGRLTLFYIVGIMLSKWEHMIMRLIGREKLDYLRGRGGQTGKWMLSWVAEVRNAHWKSPEDVTDQFPNACYCDDGSFEFPVADCRWIIQSLIAFPQGVVLISELKVKDKTHEN